jgi:hypothetical protein
MLYWEADGGGVAGDAAPPAGVTRRTPLSTSSATSSAPVLSTG